MSRFVYLSSGIDGYFHMKGMREERIEFDLLQEELEEGDIAAGDTVTDFKERMAEKAKTAVTAEQISHSDTIREMLDVGCINSREELNEMNKANKKKQSIHLDVEDFFRSAAIFNQDNFEVKFRQEGVCPTPEIILKFRNKKLVRIKKKNFLLNILNS